jgi:hypothetical protein
MHRLQFLVLLVCAASLIAAPPPDAARAQIGRLPLRFEENRGQAGTAVRYVARAGSYALEMTAAGPVMAVGGRRVELSLPGGNPAPEIRAEERMAAATNYMIGRREAWHTGVANFARVRYASVYPGIDVVYYGNQSRLEYDFVVAPGGDPGAIRLRFGGADKVAVTADGDLLVEAAGERILQKRPLVYQDNRPVAGSYRLAASALRLGAAPQGRSAGQCVLREPDILAHGHVCHEAEVLEGARDPPLGDRMGRQVGDIANGAGTRSIGSAEGLANQVSEVRAVAMLALGSLDENTCYVIGRLHFK